MNLDLKRVKSLSSLIQLSDCHSTETEFSNGGQSNQEIVVRITRLLLEIGKRLKLRLVIVLERYFRNLRERKVFFDQSSTFRFLNCFCLNNELIKVIYSFHVH